LKQQLFAARSLDWARDDTFAANRLPGEGRLESLKACECDHAPPSKSENIV
jgi:hypothetical protein